jgi:hypothetical protein
MIGDENGDDSMSVSTKANANPNPGKTLGCFSVTEESKLTFGVDALGYRLTAHIAK